MRKKHKIVICKGIHCHKCPLYSEYKPGNLRGYKGFRGWCSLFKERINGWTESGIPYKHDNCLKQFGKKGGVFILIEEKK